LTVVQAE